MIITFTAFVNKKKRLGCLSSTSLLKRLLGTERRVIRKWECFSQWRLKELLTRYRKKKKDLGKNSRRLRNVVSLVFKRFLDAGKKRKMKWNKRCKKEHRKKNSSVKKRNGRWFGWIFPVCFSAFLTWKLH